ncbi:MFS transporter [Thermomonospora cellulosilytica]|uniref:Putative MFS family arabinose efflux permease n=1 Tax=Thermomonospora cellulosilytica TaxID=1411118 RepID=A0A7W3MYE0_9ACTN|nr:MFS transporter [Thermomonospora cellulosilytica]MBA9004148.1 putative MFS family arabinose efflux permease [Thermomonospora cellulosilytica]
MFPSKVQEKRRTAAREWPAVLAVTLGIFALMTSELLPVGLLTPIGSDLGVSDGAAGLMLTVPGLVAAAAAPVVTVAGARLDRRVLLAALIGLMAAANLVCAAAPHYAVLLAARVAVGVSIGGFWAVAGGLAVRLVSARHVARATAVVFGGVSTASVVGVPAGTLLGDLSGWRTAFAAVGGLGLVSLACLLVLVPPLPSQGALAFRELPALLRRNPGVRVGVLITFLLITGHFTAYTFVRPILREVSGIDSAFVGALLMAYGVAGIAGNFAAGPRASGSPRGTLVTICAALTAVTALFALLGTGPVTGAVLLVAWGLAYGGVSVSLQTWMLKAAPDTTEAASSLFVAAFNLSIALGALIGGAAVDGAATAVLWVAGCLALLAAVAVGASREPSARPSDTKGSS